MFVAVHCATLVMVIALCMMAVDRPVASWSNAVLLHTPVARVGELLLWPIHPFMFAAAALAVAALIRRSRGPVPPWTGRFLGGALAATLALLVTIVVKLLVGRSQVFPPFLRDGVYTFHLLRGARDFTAFPSATMAGFGAFLFGIGARGVRGRFVSALVLGVLAAALIATNGHWLSDIIAGTYAGAVIGVIVRRRAAGTPEAGGT
jgi:hypothetical protein